VTPMSQTKIVLMTRDQFETMITPALVQFSQYPFYTPFLRPRL